MRRLAVVSPAMRHRLGALVDQYVSVICDCGVEFVAPAGANGRCPACGRTDGPAAQTTAGAAGHTPEAATERTMTTTHKVRGIARLMQNFHAMNDEAEKLADEMEKHAARVSEGMKTTRAVVAQVAAAADEIEAANALFTNAGAPLDQTSAG
jgi:hypothetical protein